MSEKTVNPTNVQTPIFRVSFPNVFKPRLNELSQKHEYSIVALFKKGEDLSKLEKAVEAAAEKQWGKDKTLWPQNLRMPFKDQGSRAKIVNGKKVLPNGYEAGAIFLDLKSAEKPGLVDQNVEKIIDQEHFYPGCYARATVRAYAYDAKVNKGVSFGLQNIQKVKDGEALGGRTKAEDDFAPISNSDSPVDSADDLGF